MTVRGSVVQVRFDPTEGSEQAGTRPALVISPDFMNERSPVIIVAPITSKKTESIFPFEALLDYRACGLPLPSKVMLNQLRTVDKRRALAPYGIADRETMASVDAALLIAVGLQEL